MNKWKLWQRRARPLHGASSDFALLHQGGTGEPSSSCRSWWTAVGIIDSSLRGAGLNWKKADEFVMQELHFSLQELGLRKAYGYMAGVFSAAAMLK